MKRMNAGSLVQPLFDGAVDVVGDVHGEIDALKNLLNHLGYAANGTHSEGRRLVFLGDLTDRGPDSPAVVNLVKTLVNSGCAQCVLGNHDLNILLGQRKHDNHWYFGEHWSLDDSPEPTPAVLADDAIRRGVREFFEALPLVLERHDVRIVHACWDDEMVEIARKATDAAALLQEYAVRIDSDNKTVPGLDDIDRGLSHQNRNPVKVLTSGKERRVKAPFEASGKIRYEERVLWWESYNAGPLCVFGHYAYYREQVIASSRAICADFVVAKRWKERTAATFNGTYRGQLGAVRLPERVVVFDNGEIRPICAGEPK